MTYEKCLTDVKEAFRVIEQNLSTGIRASWYREVETILNRAEADLEN